MRAPRKGSRPDLLHLESGCVLDTPVATLIKNYGGSPRYYLENGIRYLGRIGESDLPSTNEIGYYYKNLYFGTMVA